MSTNIEAHIAGLVTAAGLNAAGLSITPLPGGGNNRLYRVDTAGGPYLAKHYFRHADDTRDRLAAEYAFLTHAAHAAPGRCPRPLAADATAGLALHEFIAGRPLNATEVDAAEVSAAIDFLSAINALDARSNATLPAAAEACFSIDAHLDLVNRRVVALLPHLATDQLTGAADIGKQLADVWARCADTCRAGARAIGMDLDENLSAADRCLSPSDFGFHNALRGSDGRLRFVDFEYAGWDDPAKTAGDFFQQLAVPVPAGEFDRFAASVAAMTADATQTILRIRLLRPVYAVKWCCIVLNVFLPVHMARRRFADPRLDTLALQSRQIAKAKAQLNALYTHTLNKEAEWLMSI